jgi:hypothetical protein
MDCLNSFSVLIRLQRGYSTGGTNVKTWGTAGNLNWQIREATTGTNLAIQGFKNIDMYGIKMLGLVYTDVGANDGAIVSDFGINLTFTGQAPLVSGISDNNFWPVTLNNKSFVLSKYRNEVNMESPISGVTNINFGVFSAQGVGAETANSVTLDIDLEFIFYYKYEGE